MNSQSVNDEVIVRYLLGEMSEAEQAQLEERAFSDKDYLQSVLAVERDLIDEYVRGALSGPTLNNFEERFLTSAERRRKVAFARALAQAATEMRERKASQKVARETSSGWKSLLGFRRGPKLAYAMAFAVVLLIAIAGFWIISPSRSPQPEQAHTQTPQATPPAKPTTTPDNQPGQRAQNETPTPQLSPTVGNPTPLQPVVASLLFLPGTSRDAETAQKLVITPAASTAQLRVVVAKGDEYKSYALELRTAGGKLVRSESGLSAHAGRAGRIVTLTLQAHQLLSGDYELTLNGINAQKRAEPLGYYYFSVRKE